MRQIGTVLQPLALFFSIEVLSRDEAVAGGVTEAGEVARMRH